MLSRLLKSLRGGTGDRLEPVNTVREQGLDLTAPDAVARFADMATSELADQDACRLHNGGVLLINPDDVKAAFSQKDYSNEPSRFSAIAPRNAQKYTAATVAANIPPFQDAPRHNIVRKWLSKSVLTTLADFGPTLDQSAQDYLATLPKDTPHLLVEHVARGFVTAQICAFAGVTLGPDALKRYTAALFKLFAPIHDAQSFEATNAALTEARTALESHLSLHTHGNARTLISTMREWDHLLDDLDLTESAKNSLIADNILLVLADGVENVEAAIGNVMLAWSTHNPDQRPAITETFVRACIHETTPGQTIARIASKDMHIGGMACPAGSPVFLSLAGANARSTSDTDFSFGIGRHRCIGEGLAIQMILTCCHHLTTRQLMIDDTDIRFEPVFGHRWMRGATITLD